MHKAKDELEKAEEEIADICSERNRKLIEEHVKEVSFDGNFNAPKMWKLKKKLINKNIDKPTAKKDNFGNLISSKKPLIKLYENTYIERLKNREMTKELEDLKTDKEKLFEIRLNECSKKPSVPFNREKLLKVLKKLKNNKSRD